MTKLVELQVKLNEANEALHTLALGKKVSIVQFGTNRRTEFTTTSVKDLRSYITYLENLIRKCRTGKAREPMFINRC